MLSLLFICFAYLQIFAISGVIGENNIKNEEMLFKTFKGNSVFDGLMGLSGIFTILWTGY